MSSTRLRYNAYITTVNSTIRGLYLTFIVLYIALKVIVSIINCRADIESILTYPLVEDIVVIISI
jgi:hypothetical protein